MCLRNILTTILVLFSVSLFPLLASATSQKTNSNVILEDELEVQQNFFKCLSESLDIIDFSMVIPKKHSAGITEAMNHLCATEMVLLNYALARQGVESPFEKINQQTSEAIADRFRLLNQQTLGLQNF